MKTIEERFQLWADNVELEFEIWLTRKIDPEEYWNPLLANHWVYVLLGRRSSEYSGATTSSNELQAREFNFLSKRKGETLREILCVIP